MGEAMMPPDAMVVTDLDGTLLDSRGELSAANRATLEALGGRGVVRVVATGRNLYSALGTLPADMPINYLVFASGAGTLEWSSRELLDARHLDEPQALAAQPAPVLVGAPQHLGPVQRGPPAERVARARRVEHEVARDHPVDWLHQLPVEVG